MILQDLNQENIKERMQNWDLPFQRVVFLPYSDNKKCEQDHPFLPSKCKLLQNGQAYISVTYLQYIKGTNNKAQRYIHTPMDTLSLTKEARIYNGEKTISLTSGAWKNGQTLVI